MARNPKLTPGIQVFRGSRPRQGIMARHLSDGCCPGSGVAVDFDKLADRTRFDNSLAHSNPLGGVDRFYFPFGNGFADTREAVVEGINQHGVGFNISVLAIPTYAFVTGVGIHVFAEEPELTFELVTRNGLKLPTAQVLTVTTRDGVDCAVERDLEESDASALVGFGELGPNAIAKDIFARDAQGQFSLEADEIVLRVKTMPKDGVVTGQFSLAVSVAYEVIHRAEA